MATWNYRVMRHIEKDDDEEDFIWYGIHEVYYDVHGNITYWSHEPNSPYSGSDYVESDNCHMIRELKEDIYRFMEAVLKPVLLYDTGKEVESTES